MGSLFRRKSGRLAGRWIYTRGGRQHLAPATVQTKTQAKEWKAAIDATSKPAKPRKRGTGPTVAEIAKKWTTLREGQRDRGELAKSTVKDNLGYLRRNIVPVLGDDPVVALDVPRLRAWVRTLTGAPTTRRNIVSTLAAMLDDAIGEGWTTLRVNPARERSLRVILPEHRATTKGVDLVVPQLVAADLIACELIPFHRRVRYALAFLTGLRDGEIAGLQVGDVDLAGGVLNVKQAVSLVGNRRPGKTKTEGSARLIPLHPQLVRLLEWWLERGWQLWTCQHQLLTSPLMPNEHGRWSRPRGAQSLRADLERVGAATTVEGHPLCFRHTRSSFATWLRAAGVPRETIGALLGHEGKSVTEHYALAEMEELREAVCQIGVVINPVITAVITDHKDGHEMLSPPAPPGRFELPANGLGNRRNPVNRGGRRRGWQRTHRLRRDDGNGERSDNDD